jgi:hypothetical protein
MRGVGWAGAVVMLAAMAAAPLAQRSDSFGYSRDHDAIRYSTTPSRDAVADLDAKLRARKASLSFDPAVGYLRSLLTALSIPVESQVLAFAPNSQQRQHISRGNPRAIYFRDDVAVAWIRGAELIEIAAQDPRQGTFFYTLRQSGDAPTLTRDDKCLACHLSWDTRAVPGPFVQTVFPRRSDEEYANGFAIDHRVPLAERWGGWYVTGQRVPRSMGNIELLQPRMPASGPAAVPAPSTLAQTFDGRGYATMFSDVVALMLLEHQVHATNLITRAGWEHRVGSPHVASAVAELVDYFFFVDEAPLPHVVRGSSGFSEKFAAQGPRDAQGRSLRDLDLSQRLMRYPLSYMIYSPGFTGLPDQVKTMVRARIDDILTGRLTSPKYAHLSVTTRRAIAEILRETS